MKNMIGKIRNLKVYTRKLTTKELTYLTGGNYWNYVKNVFKDIIFKIKSL